MKILVLVTIFLNSVSTFANSYCYDWGVFSLYELEEKLIECQDAEVSVKTMEKMRKTLMTWNPILYKKRNERNFEKLDRYMKDLIQKNEKSECIQNAYALYESKVVDKVSRAIDLCSL